MAKKMSDTEELKLIIQAFKEQQKTIDNLMRAWMQLEVSKLIYPILQETVKSVAKQSVSKQKKKGVMKD